MKSGEGICIREVAFDIFIHNCTNTRQEGDLSTFTGPLAVSCVIHYATSKSSSSLDLSPLLSRRSFNCSHWAQIVLRTKSVLSPSLFQRLNFTNPLRLPRPQVRAALILIQTLVKLRSMPFKISHRSSIFVAKVSLAALSLSPLLMLTPGIAYPSLVASLPLTYLGSNVLLQRCSSLAAPMLVLFN